MTQEHTQNRYTLANFIEKTKNKDRGQGLFELESERMLEVNLDGSVWTKMGSMVAYRGQVKFKREGMLSQGMGNLLKKAISGEGVKLAKAEGQGVVYLADEGKKVLIIDLQDEALIVNGNDVLAFEESITNEIKMMKKLTAMMSGGLFNVKLSGSGMVAITSHYEPVTLMVTPDNPVTTDPNATIAWSANLEPSFKTDVSLKTFIGRGNGESVQMEFRGEGFVVVQPYEEVYYQPQAS